MTTLQVDCHNAEWNFRFGDVDIGNQIVDDIVQHCGRQHGRVRDDTVKNPIGPEVVLYPGIPAKQSPRPSVVFA